jgi:hypothetical protein
VFTSINIINVCLYRERGTRCEGKGGVSGTECVSMADHDRPWKRKRRLVDWLNTVTLLVAILRSTLLNISLSSPKLFKPYIHMYDIDDMSTIDDFWRRPIFKTRSYGLRYVYNRDWSWDRDGISGRDHPGSKIPNLGKASS